MAGVAAAVVLCGCVQQIRAPYVAALEDVVRNHDDPALVADALPAYLLAVDTAIEAEPEDQAMLAAAAELYALYSLVFVHESRRRIRLAGRALVYAERHLCLQIEQAGCTAIESGEGVLGSDLLDSADPAAWYPYAVALTAGLDANRGNPDSLLMIPRLNSLFSWLNTQLPGHDFGNLHLYYGLVLSAQPVPGAQQQARQQLQAAVEAASGRNLLARLVRELRLNANPDAAVLQDIIDANPQVPGLTLQNRIAQQWATEYLDDPESTRLGN